MVAARQGLGPPPGRLAGGGGGPSSFRSRGGRQRGGGSGDWGLDEWEESGEALDDEIAAIIEKDPQVCCDSTCSA